MEIGRSNPSSASIFCNHSSERIPAELCKHPHAASRLEDFELGSLLGRGSYACVYEARSRHTGQRVALKVARHCVDAQQSMLNPSLRKSFPKSSDPLTACIYAVAIRYSRAGSSVTATSTVTIAFFFQSPIVDDVSHDDFVGCHESTRLACHWPRTLSIDIL